MISAQDKNLSKRYDMPHLTKLRNFRLTFLFYSIISIKQYLVVKRWSNVGSFGDDEKNIKSADNSLYSAHRH